MLIDTHAHLNMLIPDKTSDRFLTDQEIASLAFYVKNADEAGVKTIINIGTSLIESINTVKIAQTYPSLFSTVGIHPCDVDDAPWQDDFAEIVALTKKKKENKIIGIGETGLDFYHQPFDQKIQVEAFRAHIELSIQEQLPLVIHVRESAPATLEVLKEYVGKITGVIHCFAQSYEFAKQVIDWGLYLGIDCPITYPKNNELREVVRQVPLESLVLETDAPFLPPQPLRGKRNEPAQLVTIVPVIAELKKISIETVMQTTTTSARRLFKI